MTISDYMRSLRERVGNRLLEIPSVCVLCFDDEDRVVLVRHAETGNWTTPGGAVEPFEVPADAALREMWEETGLHVELLRVIGVYGGPEFTTTYRNGDAVSFLVIVFLARQTGGAPRPDGRETLEVARFSRDELARLPMAPWARRTLLEAWETRESLSLMPGDAPLRGVRFDPPTWRPPSEA